MKTASHRRGVLAFTLIEVMAAVAVFSLGLVGMIQAVVSGSEMLDVAKKQTVAMQIIHGQFENIRLSNWTQVSALAAASTVDVGAANQSANLSAGFDFGAHLPGMSRNFRCTRTISTVRTDLKQVTISVTWTGSTGRTYTRRGSTYVGKNGLYVTYQRS